MRKLRRILLIAGLFAILLVWLDDQFPLNLPNNDEGFARVVVDRNGELLRTFADSRGIWRYPVTSNQVATYYLDALINYEDRWYFYHPGVNPVSMLRAAWQNWRAGKIVSGGSTLTMQVARLFHPHARSISGKLQQIVRALQLELHLSKREILELYLNYAPFGGTREGVQAASLQYLGKPALDLTRAEAALMAVLPQAPSRLRPDRYPERAQAARDKVLYRLQKSRIWNEEVIAQAVKESVSVFTPVIPKLAPLLARRLTKAYPRQSVIQTTIDADLQLALQDLAKSYSHSLPDGSSTAILVVDETNQEVIGYVGSADFDSPQGFGHVDMIQAIRSPGSTLKPFLYGLAIDDGLVHSASLLSDVPREFSSYRPANFNNGFIGPVTLTDALKHSLNIPAVEVLEHLGPLKFTAKLKNAGLNLHLPGRSKPNLSMVLGGVGVRLEALVQAYGAFTQGGVIRQLQYIKSEQQKSKARYLMSEGAAWVIAKILKDIPEPDRIMSNAVANKRVATGWKSGTSYGFRDAWSVGFNGRYRVGVWVGRPDGTPLPGHYGAISAAPLMFTAFDYIGPGKSDNGKPDSVSEVDICWPLGTRKSDQREIDCHLVKKALVVDGVVPKSLSSITEENDWLSNPYLYWINRKTGLLVDASCKSESREQRQTVLWQKQLEPWINSKFRRQYAIPATDESCPNPLKLQLGQLRISGITNGSIIRAAGASDEMPVVTAKVIGARGKRWWFLNGSKQNRSEVAETISVRLDTSGEKQLIVVDETGNVAKVDFVVQG